MEERLQKILARAGVASRRAAERLIEEGRVKVNGEIVKEMGTRADAARDDIRVDGSRIRVAEALVYLVLNKPKGVVSTRSDPGGRPTVMDLVPKIAGLFPVGRLDVTTEGLLFLTTDGEFALRVSHPRYEVPRVYMAKVSRIPDERALQKMRTGVYSDGDRLVADHVKIVEADNNAWLEVTVHEGRNREVRRLLEAVGHPVSKLRRVAVGPVTDRGLAPGQFRELLPREVKVLLGTGPKDAPKRRTSRVRHPGGKGRPARRPTGERSAEARRGEKDGEQEGGQGRGRGSAGLVRRAEGGQGRGIDTSSTRRGSASGGLRRRGAPELGRGAGPRRAGSDGVGGVGGRGRVAGETRREDPRLGGRGSDAGPGGGSRTGRGSGPRRSGPRKPGR